MARIRVPGGRLSADQLRTVLAAAPDGTVELTSRANLQVRGVGAESGLGSRLAEAGLLPSATHERVRNIIASPLGDCAELVCELDRELCARPGLAELPGRFLFAVDDGPGDVAWLDADIAALRVPDGAAILLGGADIGLRTPASRVTSTMLACAERFLALRSDEWRIAELADGPRRIATLFPLVEDRIASRQPATGGPFGRISLPDGRIALGAAVPLGRLTRAQGMALASISDELVITPWRTMIVPNLVASQAEATVATLAATGLLLDPDAPGVGMSACTGRPGCVKALADVRADAAAMIANGTRAPLPVHWSGCARRCGRPRGEVLDLVATEHGYLVRQGDR